MSVARTVVPLGIAALAIAVVVVVIAAVSEGGSRTLRAVFDPAVQLAPGQEVRVAGRKVGEIGSIEIVDGHAVVALEIREEAVWPLRRGTTAQARWGSTTSLAYRHVELQPGPASAPELPDGGVLSRDQTVTPFELDEAYRIFRGRTDDDLKAFVGELAETLDGRARPLRRGLRDAPGGLGETAAFLRELGADGEALRTLAVSGDEATTALAARESELAELVGHAAGTFDELADHAGDQQAALERAPSALAEATSTLARLDTSLAGLGGLVEDLRPGARELRRFAGPARRALSELRQVAPIAVAALRSGRRAAPELARLLETGTGFMPRLGTVLEQLDPMVGCIRPYGPELAGNLATWAGYNKNFDEGGHYARTFDLLFNSSLLPGTPFNSQQISERSDGRLTYAMPRPPGLNAGQPWFQPECGAGPESLDPRRDPEGAGR